MGAVQLLQAGDGPGEAGPLLQGRSHGGSCSRPQGSHNLGHGAQSVTLASLDRVSVTSSAASRWGNEVQRKPLMSLHRCAGRGQYGSFNPEGITTNVLEAQPPCWLLLTQAGGLAMSSSRTMCARCNLDGVSKWFIHLIAMSERAMAQYRNKTVSLIPANIGDRLPGQYALEPPKPHREDVTNFSLSPGVSLNTSPCKPISVANWSEDWKVVSVKRKLLKYPPLLWPLQNPLQPKHKI